MEVIKEIEEIHEVPIEKWVDKPIYVDKYVDKPIQKIVKIPTAKTVY